MEWTARSKRSPASASAESARARRVPGARRRSSERVGARGGAVDHDHLVGPGVGEGAEHGARGAPGAQEEDARAPRLAPQERGGGGGEAGDVGVVAPHLAPLAPEGVARPGALHGAGAALDGEGGGLLVGDGDVPRPAGARDPAQEPGELGGAAAQRQVHAVQPGGAEGGVLDQGGEGVGDGVAEEGHEARGGGGEGGHGWRMGASRSKTAPTRGSRSRTVAS